MIKTFLNTLPLKTGHATRGVGFYTRELGEALSRQPAVRLVKKEEEADVIHMPFFDLFFLTLPPRDKKPVVVTVHDVIPLLYPSKYKSGIRGRLKLSVQKKRLKNMDAVITDSETSKKDIVRLLDIPQEKVHVTHLAPGSRFKKMKPGKWRQEITTRHNLSEKFVLYVGDVNFNKNVQSLIRALQYLPPGISLVLVGKGFESKIPETEEIFGLVDKLGIETRVQTLGFVPDEDLVQIYNLSAVVCQPSLYEGFGFPVLEAQACGVPVVAAKTQCLVEMAGSAALFVDPRNPSEIASGIQKVLSDKKLAKSLTRAGLENLKRFSWEKTAAETIKVYEAVL